MIRTFKLSFALVHEVHERAARPIEDKPSFLPPPTGAAKLVEISTAAVAVNGDVLCADLKLVPAAGNVGTKVEVSLIGKHGQVAGQRPLADPAIVIPERDRNGTHLTEGGRGFR